MKSKQSKQCVNNKKVKLFTVWTLSYQVFEDKSKQSKQLFIKGVRI